MIHSIHARTRIRHWDIWQPYEDEVLAEIPTVKQVVPVYRAHFSASTRSAAAIKIRWRRVRRWVRVKVVRPVKRPMNSYKVGDVVTVYGMSGRIDKKTGANYLLNCGNKGMVWVSGTTLI